MDRNLNGPFKAISLDEIRRVVDVGFELKQLFLKLIIRPRGHFLAERRVFWHGNHQGLGENGVQVEARSPYYNRHAPFFLYGGKGGMKVALVLKDVVFRVDIDHIDEVIGHGGPAQIVVLQILARSNVEAPIDLSGVGGQDFAAQKAGEGDAEGGFPRSGGAEHKNGVEGGHSNILSARIAALNALWTCDPKNCNNDDPNYTPAQVPFCNGDPWLS